MAKKDKAEKIAKEFELTADEQNAIKEKAIAEKPEGGISEAIKKAAVQKAIAFMSDKEQDDVNKYIESNLMITEITKAFMVAYIKKFAVSDKDQKWIKEDFKKASTKTATKKVSTVCMGLNGVPVHKIKKDGTATVVYKRVDAITGETYETFNLAGARNAFIEYFKITPKPNKFTPKAERQTKKYDEFDDLF